MVGRRMRAARGAVFGVFTLNGVVLAMWVVHIPAITDRAGVSASALGMFVLLFAGAALVGMRAAGPAADRFGSRTVVAIAATAVTVTVLGPGFATGPVALALALVCFGLGNGALDVSMNTQAVHVERAYHRPIMSAFHAMFSAGGFAGALIGAAAQRADWPPQLTMTCASIAGLLCLTLLVPRLIDHHESPSRLEHYEPEPPLAPAAETTTPSTAAGTQPPPGVDASARPDRCEETAAPPALADETTAVLTPVAEANTQHAPPVEASARPDSVAEANTQHAPPVEANTRPDSVDLGVVKPGTREVGGDRGMRRRRVLALGVVAFVLLLAEGVAADWSALQVRERLGVAESAAALAFGAFSATMTVGRFLTDRVSGAFGPVAIVRYGSLLAAAGFAVVIASPWLPLTLVGWAMCGLGIAGGVPQIFSTAGNLGGSTAATDMSRVFTIGYLGLLAGPAAIGWLTALIPLTAALAVPLVLTLACAAAARVVSR